MTAAASPLAKIDLNRLLSPQAQRCEEMEALWRFLQAEDAKLPDQSRMSPPEQRIVRDQAARRFDGDLEPVASVARVHAPGLAGAPDVVCDLVTPENAQPGCVVYLHGGGWTFGSLVSHARVSRALANETRTRVLAVDYRLAPENPYPAPLDDAVAAWRYVVKRAGAEAGFDGPLAVAGDSAGANLGLAAILREGEAGRRRPDMGLFFYGVWNCDFDTPSYRRFGTGHGLTRASMEKFLDFYVPGGDGPGALRFEPFVSPMLASEATLARLPPIYLAAAGLDPLLCDSVDFARKLEAAGATFDINVHEGLHHGFMQLSARLSEARRAYGLMGDFFRRWAAQRAG
jgi:acetyl esterase